MTAVHHMHIGGSHGIGSRVADFASHIPAMCQGPGATAAAYPLAAPSHMGPGAIDLRPHTRSGDDFRQQIRGQTPQSLHMVTPSGMLGRNEALAPHEAIGSQPNIALVRGTRTTAGNSSQSNVAVDGPQAHAANDTSSAPLPAKANGANGRNYSAVHSVVLTLFGVIVSSLF